MYTELEMQALINRGTVISSITVYNNGRVTIQVGHTINYYSKNQNGTWDNYDCRTVGG